MSYPIKGMVMPGGWHYIGEWNGNKYRVDSDISLDDLYQKVLEYRLSNSIHVGNVRYDVDKYICDAYPQACVNYAAPPVMQSTPVHSGTGFQHHVLDWLGKLRMESVQLKDYGEAVERARTCAQCPENQPAESSCPACNQAIREFGHLIRQGRNCELSKNLGGCKKTNICLKTAIWLDRKHLPSKPDVNNCWLK